MAVDVCFQLESGHVLKVNMPNDDQWINFFSHKVAKIVVTISALRKMFKILSVIISVFEMF